MEKLSIEDGMIVIANDGIRDMCTRVLVPSDFWKRKEVRSKLAHRSDIRNHFVWHEELKVWFVFKKNPFQDIPHRIVVRVPPSQDLGHTLVFVSDKENNKSGTTN